MTQLIKMAFRNLGRNLRRTILTALSLALGTAMLLFMAATIEGEIRGAVDISIILHTGHMQIRSAEYDDEKLSLAREDLVEDPEAIAAKLDALPQVTTATPRLFASGILAVGPDTVGVRVLGIDPPSIANLPFQEGLVAGEYITPDDREGIMIGEPLAERFKLNAGDRVNLLVNTSDGSTDTQLFTIRGLYSTNTPGYDKSTILMPLAKAQAFTQTDNHASIIFILLQDRDLTSAIRDSLQTARYEVTDWQTENALFIQVQEFAGVYTAILYFILLAITSTVIVNTLVMAVYERTREMGVLLSIGMKGRQLMALFLAEAGLLAIGGIIVGMALGGIVVAYYTSTGMYIGDMGFSSGFIFGDTIYPHLTARDSITLPIVALGVTLLASLYPALLASRLEPVEALHGTN